MPDIIKTKGFILKTAPFKESSLFITLLTNDCGKIKVLAKGARRPKSKFCGTMEIFNLDEIIFYKKETKEVYTLSDASVIEDFKTLRLSPRKVNAGMVLCEFFEKTLPPEEYSRSAFRLLFGFLKDLQKTSTSRIKPLTICYLIKALPESGVRPHLTDCVRCSKKVVYDDKKIDFSIAAGGVVCEKDYDDTVIFLKKETINLLDGILSGKRIDIEDTAFLELERIIPDYLSYHLNNLVLNSLRHLEQNR